MGSYAHAPHEQPSITVSYYRGGTSKALFFHASDLPPPGSFRDRLLMRLMGTPDPMQIDGMGGTHIVTSKIAIISQPEPGSDLAKEVDVEYEFAQVGVAEKYISYSGNCGNISSAVGVFAMREGLLDSVPWREGQIFGTSTNPSEKGQSKAREVRIWNTGTQKKLISHVPVDPKSGNVLEAGGYAIDGCPGSGAPILMDYKDVIGAALNRGALPTGNAIDSTTIVIPDGSEATVQFTVCDVANPIVFAPAASFGLGLDGPAPAALALTDNKALVASVKRLRGKAAELLGMCSNWEKVDEESPMLPMVALVAAPGADNRSGNIQSRIFLDNKCHTSMAGTGAVCHTACSRIEGTIVEQLAGKGAEEGVFKIRHPGGVMPVAVETKKAEEAVEGVPEFETLCFVRTARRIFKGNLDVPETMWDEWWQWKRG